MAITGEKGPEMSESDRQIAMNGDVGQGERLAEKKNAFSFKM